MRASTFVNRIGAHGGGIGPEERVAALLVWLTKAVPAGQPSSQNLVVQA
jgi:hypothetical protein